eukprot:14305160-Alexandrium_andersonii.AAC.1
MMCELLAPMLPTLYLCNEGVPWQQVKRIDPDGVLEPEVRHHEVTAPKSGTPFGEAMLTTVAPQKSSPCPEALRGLVRKVLGEE